MTKDFVELNQGKFFLSFEALRQIQDALKEDLHIASSEIIALSGGKDLLKGKAYAEQVIRILNSIDDNPKAKKVMACVKENMLRYETREFLQNYSDFSSNENSQRKFGEAMSLLTGIDNKNHFNKDKGLWRALVVQDEVKKYNHANLTSRIVIEYINSALRNLDLRTKENQL